MSIRIWLVAVVVAASPQDDAPRFVEAADRLGLGGVPAYRVFMTDVDDDGYPDAIVQIRDAKGPVNPGGVARLFLNVADPRAPGGRGFRQVPGALDRITEGRRDSTRNTGVFVVAGDIDNDGRLDLFRACYQEQADHPEFPDTGERSAVALGDGKGGFSVVARSGVGEDGPVTTCGAALFDFDRDGRLDMFVGNWYVSFGRGLESHPDRLYRGDGTGRFKDITESAGLMTARAAGRPDSSRPTYGVSHTDVDNDGHPDLLVSTYGRQWNRLWRNTGRRNFVEWGPRTGFDGDEDRSGVYPDWTKEDRRIGTRSPEAPFRANGNSFSAVPADFDGDGDIDLFCCEIAHGWAGPSSDLTALLVNSGEAGGWKFSRVSAPFERPKRNKWWNQGDYLASWGDFDNDGLLDLALCSGSYPDNQRLRVYRQRKDRSFEDVTAAWGIDFPDAWHMSVADVDGDGALDIVATGHPASWNKRSGDVLAVWLNRAPRRNRWIALTLEGAAGRPGSQGGANRSAIGARVRIAAGGVTQTREVLSSLGHFGSHSPLTQHFGLGEADIVEVVEVFWPDAEGTRQTFVGLKPNAHYRLVQGERAPR
jgi:hypothetical protein